MKKNISLSLVVVFSSVLFSACKKKPNQAVQTSVPVQQEEVSDGFTGSIKELMGLGKAQKCTWTTPEQGSSTIYVDGDKSRIEVNMLAMEDQPARQMITIADPTWAYNWDPMTKKGMKTNVEEMEKEVPETPEIPEFEPVDDKSEDENDYQTMVNQDHEFECESWKSDSNMFVPPTEVEFVDMNMMVDQMQQNMEGMKKVCEMLSGDEKAECLKGFEE